MKNTIKKADMHGQFIDMQKTRGGIPARLRSVPNIMKHLLNRNSISWVVGRTGWFNKTSPIDETFVHCTDYQKAITLYEVSWKLSYGKRYEAFIRENMAKYNFQLTPQYQKLWKAL